MKYKVITLATGYPINFIEEEINKHASKGWEVVAITPYEKCSPRRESLFMVTFVKK